MASSSSTPLNFPAVCLASLLLMLTFFFSCFVVAVALFELQKPHFYSLNSTFELLRFSLFQKPAASSLDIHMYVCCVSYHICAVD